MFSTKNNSAFERLAPDNGGDLGGASLPNDPTISITIEQMKAVLRKADCLYDNTKIWTKLGAKGVPKLSDDVIRDAYWKGGRVLLECSSISYMADVVRAAGHHGVSFWYKGNKQSQFTAVFEPIRWIAAPSHVDQSTLKKSKDEVVTIDHPASTPGVAFAARAYAALDGGRQPKGFENRGEFTSEPGLVIGSSENHIHLHRNVVYDRGGFSGMGAAHFGPPRS